MKDKLASYNRLIGTFVIVAETMICGVLFILFAWLKKGELWDGIHNTYSIQIALTLMLCYSLSAVHSGVVLHRRNVHPFQILKRILRNMFQFVILGGLILTVGNFMDIWSPSLFGYLFLLFLCFVFFSIQFTFSYQAVSDAERTCAFCCIAWKRSQ